MSGERYDVIIIGTGAGGATLASITSNPHARRRHHMSKARAQKSTGRQAVQPVEPLGLLPLNRSTAKMSALDINTAPITDTSPPACNLGVNLPR